MRRLSGLQIGVSIILEAFEEGGVICVTEEQMNWVEHGLQTMEIMYGIEGNDIILANRARIRMNREEAVG